MVSLYVQLCVNTAIVRIYTTAYPFDVIYTPFYVIYTPFIVKCHHVCANLCEYEHMYACVCVGVYMCV